MQRKGTIKIGAPYLEDYGERTRIVSRINVADDIRLLWFEVPKEYGQYLCIDRCDGFLVGLLYEALHNGYDIVCDAKVTGRLLFQIKTCLLPSVTRALPELYLPAIDAEIAETAVDNVGAVGMGISCGVDAMHILKNQWKSEFKNLNITHLILYNVGAFWKEKTQFSWQLSQARKFADEYGFNLIETDSNLHVAFPRDHLYALEYSNCMAILILQKLWGVYFHGSTGYDFRDYSINEVQIEDSPLFDLLSCYCFSTEKLSIISEGEPFTRIDKIKNIIDFEPAQKYLDVCVLVGEGSKTGYPNCGICFKCRRTLMMLDALGALEKFSKVFDISYYKKNLRDYYRWLLQQKWNNGNPGNHMIAEIYDYFVPRMPKLLVAKDWFAQKWFKIRAWLKRFRLSYLFYRRFIKRYPNWRDI